MKSRLPYFELFCLVVWEVLVHLLLLCNTTSECCHLEIAYKTMYGYQEIADNYEVLTPQNNENKLLGLFYVYFVLIFCGQIQFLVLTVYCVFVF